MALLAKTALACEHRVATIPPVTKDPSLGREVVRQVIAAMAKEQARDPCYEFIDFEQTVERFDHLGLNFYFTVPPQDLLSGQLEDLQHDFAASHLMVISYDEPKHQAVATLYAIEPARALRQSGQTTLTLDASAAAQAASPTYLRYLGLFTPNMVTLGLTSSKVYFNFPVGYEETDTRIRSTLPPIVSSIAFNKIQHRKGFGLFDVGFSLFPGIFLFAINQDTKVRRDMSLTEELFFGSETHTFHVEAYGGCSNMNGELAIISPVGITYASLGYGPCLIGLGKEGEDLAVKFDLAARLNLGHRIFAGDSMFIYLEFDFLFFSQPLYESRLAKADTITRTSLGAGWYVSDVESLFVETWRDVFYD